MMVSHGCVRLRNEDIKLIYYNSYIGTKVKIINSPIKLGRCKNVSICIWKFMLLIIRKGAVYSNNIENLLTTENIY